MFKEKLMEALQKAADYHNAGMPDSDAVAKTASEHDFNADQTRRLVETYNTAKTICFYKAASERASDFSLADSGAVLTAVFGAGGDKKKAGPALTDYSCYDSRMLIREEGELLPADEYLKAASAEPERAFGDHEARSILMRADDYRKLADDAAVAASAAQDDYDMAVYSLAEMIDRGGRTPEAVACLGHGKVASDVAGRLDQDEVAKAASVRFTAFDVENPDVMELYGRLGELHVKMAMCTAVAGTFGRMAEELAAVVRNDSAETKSASDEFLSEKVRGMLDSGSWIKVSQSQGGRGGKGGGTASITDPMGVVLQGLGGGARSAIQDVTTQAVGTALTEDAASKALTNKAKQLHRKFILEKLMTTDPILKGVPEQDVISAYQTLVQLAPEVSLNEDVSRSILRAATGTAGSALAPYDAKTFVDLNSAIMAQLEQQGGKKKQEPSSK